MKAQISIENDKWIRVDAIKKNGKRGMNLWHTFVMPGVPISEQIKAAIDSVKFNFPAYTEFSS